VSGSWQVERGSRRTRRHPRDDPRAVVGEYVRVGVGVRVGPMEFQLMCAAASNGDAVRRQSTLDTCHLSFVAVKLCRTVLVVDCLHQGDKPVGLLRLIPLDPVPPAYSWLWDGISDQPSSAPPVESYRQSRYVTSRYLSLPYSFDYLITADNLCTIKLPDDVTSGGATDAHLRRQICRVCCSGR